jgi:hypothetical protein
MVYSEWEYGPFGLDSRRGQTLRCQRTVLVVVHPVTSALTGPAGPDEWPVYALPFAEGIRR